MPGTTKPTVVVVGNGMVGLTFCERLVTYDTSGAYRIVTFCEDARAAYDRAGLTNFVAHRDAEKALRTRRPWYQLVGIDLQPGDRAAEIDRNRKFVRSARGVVVHYDKLVLATGSYPYVPDIPGIRQTGVFAYRTPADVDAISSAAHTARNCVVLGAGVRGLAAAATAVKLGLSTTMVTSDTRLAQRQLDANASHVLANRVASSNVTMHLGQFVREIHGQGRVSHIQLECGRSLPCDLLIVAAGIRRRDRLAYDCDLPISPAGGVRVNDQLQTEDPDIYAIGECGVPDGHEDGLFVQNETMADIVAANLCGGNRSLNETSQDAELNLFGTRLVTFGQWRAGSNSASTFIYVDASAGVYRKLLFSLNGGQLLGGLLIGDTSEVEVLRQLTHSGRASSAEASAMAARHLQIRTTARSSA
jgi:NAD(P)H-nitrite reductase large subunit